MAEVSCYSMDLYCDHKEDKPDFGCCGVCPNFGNYGHGGNACGVFTGISRTDCLRQAKKAGWKFEKDGRVICERHHTKRKKK